MPDNINIIAAPSLSEDGWIYSGKGQADYIMACFLASDYSQSYVHYGQVSSFAWLIATYGDRSDLLRQQTTTTLQTLFGRYFNNVVVECSDVTPADKPNTFNMGIYVSFQDADGNTGKLSELVLINGSRFEIMRKLSTESNY